MEPLFSDQAAVGHHRDAGEMQLLLAEPDHFPEVLALLDKERLTATKVDLLGACLAQQPEPSLRPLHVKVVTGLGGVKAESTGVVTLAGEVVVDAEGHGLRFGLFRRLQGGETSPRRPEQQAAEKNEGQREARGERVVHGGSLEGAGVVDVLV